MPTTPDDPTERFASLAETVTWATPRLDEDRDRFVAKE